ncbi:Usherin [Acipenser ruthenus]|uniref:Usherin n=1 Tax=Acipenser ruthenus TaxID=7906 RepID=A0A662YWD8_ACIRT|nr:Usherin [Acipenser ruthenus]
MNCPLLQKGAVLLFYTIACYISANQVHPQGHFPRLENIGAYKNVTTVPTQSTCGSPERNAFCQSTVAMESLQSCTQQFCIQECAYRSATSSSADLLSAGIGTCITEDKNDVHPGSLNSSTSFIFRNQRDCFVKPSFPNAGLGSSFTLTVWLKPEQRGLIEIYEVFSGKLPHLHTQTECRCPSSHPRVHPLVQRYCIPNGADDTTNDRVLRLNLDAHPLNYINDNDIGTSWISTVFTNLTQLENGVTITFDLLNGEYQVFYVILQFLSPQPEAVQIQRKKSSSSEWVDWQYLARNCSIFGMENNGPLEKPDSVNCLQLPSNVPYSRGNVTFSVLTPEPNHRPGYNDFYNTPTLQEFVKATHVRIHLKGQYYTTQASVNFRHRYYGVDEITISGRCNCYGHAAHCDTSLNPYRCACLTESHTEGDNCNRCMPLFNDKPFNRGDQVRAYNCKPCQCYNHATRCHYNSSLDPFPNEHFRGGGGVCDNCQHNTTGRNCELCRHFFFRELDVALSAIDVCNPCDCYGAGVINGSLLCKEIGGQCKCKRHVSGRQCNQCQHGFYNLQHLDPDGCSPCNCNTSGTLNGDITCHQNSGQCKCKTNVIGLTCDRCNFGFKFLSSTNPDGCEPCRCNRNSSLHQFCHPFTGQCECRERVGGLLCDTCRETFYGLSSSGSCWPCDCNLAGTVPGTVCDAWTGQCFCKPNAGGRRCDTCLDGYHSLHHSNSLGCLYCSCDTAGTVNGSTVCDKSTGQCPCKTSARELQCNRCAPHSYNLTFSNHQGCQLCDCDHTGTVVGTVCDQISGQCVCLPTRQGRSCNLCKSGFYLPPLNETGCLPCDCHSVGSIHKICSGDTGSKVFNDTELSPYTVYSYYIVASNVHGLTRSATVSYRTMAGIPFGDLYLNLIGSAGSQTASFNWTSSLNTSGPIEKYVLSSITLGDPEARVHYQGHQTSVTVTELAPFTRYNFSLKACTSGGCAEGRSITVVTAQIPPEGQAPPRIKNISSTELYVEWDPPVEPNGIIIRYELYMQGPIELGQNHILSERRVFYDSGWFNPQPVLSSANENALMPPQTNTTVRDLEPFAMYQFRVYAVNMAGSTHSEWVSGKTGEAAPVCMPPPTIYPLNSSSLNVTWLKPSDNATRGLVTEYRINIHEEQTSNQFAPPVVSKVLHKASPHEQAYKVTGLKPYRTYNFTITLCNQLGCITSLPASGQTLAAGIKLSFRTREHEGLILFAVSAGSQEEYIALQIHNGRPYFLFDPQASAVAVSPLNDGGKLYNDNQWHHVIAKRNQAVGTIIVDNQYRGTVSATSGSTIIGENTGVFLGGLPKGFLLLRDDIGDAKLVERGFLGCISDVYVKKSDTPSEVWELLDWEQAEEKAGIYHSWEGCPKKLMEGAHFLGQGFLELHSFVFSGGTEFEISFEFRTDQLNGLLLFAFNKEELVYLAAELRSGTLSFMFKTSQDFTRVDLWLGLSYCEGSWNRVTLRKQGSVATASMNKLTEQVSGTVAEKLNINSPIYLGGIPAETQSSFRGLGLQQVPQSVPTPSRVHSVNGYSVEVSWDEPAGVRGVIEKYVLKAYNEDSPSMPPITAEFTSTHTLTAPSDVEPPAADAHPYSLSLFWDVPHQPNGVVTEYALHSDNMLIYKGNQTQYNITEPVPVTWSVPEPISASTSTVSVPRDQAPLPDPQPAQEDTLSLAASEDNGIR